MKAKPLTTPRQQKILELFTAKGGWLSTPRLARLCVEEGLYSQEEIQSLALREIQRDVRAVLKSVDPQTRLPRALPTPEMDEQEHRIWGQIELLPYEHLAFNIEEGAKALWYDYARLEDLHTFTLRKFKRAPAIPQVYPSADWNPTGPGQSELEFEENGGSLSLQEREEE